MEKKKYNKIKSIFKKSKLIKFIPLFFILFLLQFPARELISLKISEKAEKYLNSSGEYNLEKSEKLCKIALKISDKNGGAHYQLAKINLVKSHFGRGIFEASRALEINPKNKRAHYVRGLNNGYAKNYDEAEEDFQKFIAWSPNEWAGYVDLSWVYINSGKYEKAIATANNGLILFPENIWLYSNKGLAQYKAGEFEEAKNNLEIAQKLASRMKPEDWILAYPGNNPENSEKGVKEIRTAINYNLKLAYEIIGDKEKSDSLELNLADFSSLSKYSGKKYLKDGVTLSACNSATYYKCSTFTCDSYSCDSDHETCPAAPTCSSNSDCCTPNGCQSWTCRDYQCNDGCGGSPWGSKICYKTCYGDQVCSKLASLGSGYYERKKIVTCSSDYSGTCNSDTWTYWCPNDWFYSESSEVREVVCCTDEDCQNDHGGNKNYKCENNRTECNCYPTDAGCGSGYCKNIKNACWNGCNWENGTKDCCTPNPELCKNNEELKEAAAKTCIGALSIDECGGYTCEGTMNCKGWKEQSKKSTK